MLNSSVDLSFVINTKVSSFKGQGHLNLPCSHLESHGVGFWQKICKISPSLQMRADHVLRKYIFSAEGTKGLEGRIVSAPA